MPANDPILLRLAEPAQQRRPGCYSNLVRDHYAAFGDAYEAAWGSSFHFAIFSTADQPRAEAIRATELMVAEAGAFGPGMRLLDVGCGRGGPAIEIAEHTGAKVMGVDLLWRNVLLARARAEERSLADRVHFLQADALTLPFADESFDGVYAFESGCHAADKARYYGECARVLCPGGAFVGIDWLAREGMTPEERERWIEPVCRQFTCPDLISPSRLRDLLAASGLVPDEVENLVARGNVAPNWEMLDSEAFARLQQAVEPRILARVAEGGAALLEANRSGAFFVAFWRARKPYQNAAG